MSRFCTGHRLGTKQEEGEEEGEEEEERSCMQRKQGCYAEEEECWNLGNLEEKNW